MTRSAMRFHGAAALVVAAFVGLGAVGDAFAQLPNPTAAKEAEAPATEPAVDPAGKLRELRAALEEERNELVGRAAAGAAPEGARAELELIAAIGRAYDAQLEALDRRSTLEQARVALEDRLVAGPAGALADPPPYALPILDAMADARDAQAQRTRAVRSALKEAEDTLVRADAELERLEEERRLARDAAQAAPNAVRAAQLRASQHLAELRSRAASAQRDLAVLERDNLRSDAALQEKTDQLLTETVAWVREHIDVDENALRAPLREIDEREFETTRSLERTERELHAAEAGLALAERRLAASLQPPPELIAEVDARRVEHQLLGRRAASLADRAKRLETNRALWQQRQSILAGAAGRSSLDEWEQALEDDLQEWKRTARLSEARLLELRQEADAARARAAEAATRGGAAARWETQRAQGLGELAALYEQELTTGAADRRLAQRVLEDIRSRTSTISFAERLSAAANQLRGFWDTELVAVDDQAITVGKVAGALLVFVLGLLASVVATRILGHVLRRRLDDGAASAIQGLLFYVLVAFTFLLALRTVNIPLTAFAIVGGALAIGVGFGSQNIVNNFISGLILLAERPIKVGDLVQVGDVRGYVERIGARSTRVRTPENTHLIIPNSHFLEKEVVNWTLSDDDIRASVDVGVIYGSPTREVDRLLRRAMTEHGQILDSPVPDVWFKGFGDNSLDFQMLFWIRSRQLTERRRIESDVRFRVDSLFREAGIVIAFPQRDVHLDTAKPLQVRMVTADAQDEGDQE